MVTKPRQATSTRLEEEQELATVRRLLVGLSQQQTQRLASHFGSTNDFADYLASILHSSAENNHSTSSPGQQKLINALDAFTKDSVQRNVFDKPKQLGTIIAPAMGPAIRKSVQMMFASLLQSFESTMEQSFSWRGIRWRWEAIRTRKPLADIILRDTILYRVDHVFVIHRQTGLLLCEAVRESTVTREPELVSSMISAIASFVADAFSSPQTKQSTPSRVGAVDAVDTANNDNTSTSQAHTNHAQESTGGLESFRVGDQTMFVEYGEKTIVACLVWGQVSLSFREQLQELKELVESDAGAHLAQFHGDNVPFQKYVAYANQLLQQQAKQKPSRSKLLWGLLAVVACVAIAWFGYHKYDRSRAIQQQKDAFSQNLITLKETPGIVVTEAVFDPKTPYIFGLQDPLADWPPEVVVSKPFSPYLSVEPSIVKKRAELLWHPPEGVSVRMATSVAYLEGIAHSQWIKKVRDTTVVGVARIDTISLVPTELLQLQQEIATVNVVFRPNSVSLSRHSKKQLRTIRSLLLRAKRAADLTNIVVTLHMTAYPGPLRAKPEVDKSLAFRRFEKAKEVLETYPEYKDLDVQTKYQQHPPHAVPQLRFAITWSDTTP